MWKHLYLRLIIYELQGFHYNCFCTWAKIFLGIGKPGRQNCPHITRQFVWCLALMGLMDVFITDLFTPNLEPSLFHTSSTTRIPPKLLCFNISKQENWFNGCYNIIRRILESKTCFGRKRAYLSKMLGVMFCVFISE